MKKIITILFIFISPTLLKGQTGCSNPDANNYYCNTAFDCVFSGLDSNGAPVWSLPEGFIDDGSCIISGCILEKQPERLLKKYQAN